MSFRPLHDWVLIKRSNPEEKTSSGIIIPDAARTKSTEGIVEAIGPGKFEQEKGKKEKKFVPTVLKPGQRVMFIDYMTKDIALDGDEITIIQEDNILGVFESFGELAVKKQYHVEVKRDHPPMVQAEKAKAETKKTFEAEVTFRKAVKKTGKAKKQVKADVKTNTKKSVVKGKDNKMKKTVKKAAPKKAAPAKKAVAKKTVKKAVAKKAAPKKAVVKKAAAPKKTVAKKAAAPKKTVAKKAAAPKKAVVKKAVKKTAAKKK